MTLPLILIHPLPQAPKNNWRHLNETYVRPNRYISPSELAALNAAANRKKVAKKRRDLPLGVAMRTRSELLTVKLPSAATKQHNYCKFTDDTREVKPMRSTMKL